MCIRDSWNLIHFFLIASTAFGARGLLAIYFPILLIYGFPLLGTTGRLAWWRLTYPKHLTGYGTRHCSPSSPPLGFLLLFAYLCLAFFQVAQYRLWLMERLLLHFLSIVVFLKVRSYLLLYSYFSLMIFSPALLTLSTHMPMTRPFILQLISILLLLLLLELPLALTFPILFSLIWIEFPIGVVSTLSLIHISEPTRLLSISYAVFCL